MVNFIKGILLSIAISTQMSFAQTTIINPLNATGTSGANGSFQNGTNTLAANGWTVVNPGAGARWFAGPQSFCVGTKGAYVGTAAGNNNYDINTARIVHFYDDVTFPAGQTCITLSFNWKCEGEFGWDGIRVSLGSTTVAPVVDTDYQTTDPSAIILGNTFYNNNTTCNNVTITIPPAFAGTTRRLVFSWINDASIVTAPAGTIDAISLVSNVSTIPTCATGFSPANGATNVPFCGTNLTWTAPASTGCNAATTYDVYFGTTATPPFIINQAGTNYTPALLPNTTYFYQVIPRNTAGPATGCPIRTFTTTSVTNYSLLGNATSASPFDCATLTTTVGETGCAWDANSVMNFAANFTYDIQVNLGSDDAGADGMSFVFQNDPLGLCRCGSAGGSFGSGGIANSVIIELDTYTNFEDRDDFTAPFMGTFSAEDPDHLDIWLNGNINPDFDGDADFVSPGERPVVPNAVRLQNPPGTNYNIENGANHIFRVSWNAGTQTLTASVLNTALTTTFGTISTTFNPLTVFGTNTPFFGFTAATGGLSNNQSFCLPTVLLPVEVSSFDVNCFDGKARLDWMTESEKNNDFFSIEHSCDGINFTSLKQINGNGNSTNTQSYSIQMETMCQNVNYYRLSQTDKDGEMRIISTKSVQPCDLFEEILVYPNPANNQFTIAWDNSSMESIAITDALGKVLTTIDISEKGLSNIEIETLNYSNGVYFVKVNQTFGSKTYKIVIEHR